MLSWKLIVVMEKKCCVAMETNFVVMEITVYTESLSPYYTRYNFMTYHIQWNLVNRTLLSLVKFVRVTSFRIIEL